MKKVLVHIGPHKTGSTAIQKNLSAQAGNLRRQNIKFLHGEDVHRAAMMLAREDFEQAERVLKQISSEIEMFPEETIIMSQEDFSGDLIGRTRKRRVYPKLTKNLRILVRALRPHKVRFLFFERNEDEWLRSCYVQHLKFRTKFSSLEGFRDYYEVPFTWVEKLSKPRKALGDALETVEYSKDPMAGIAAVYNAVGATVPLSNELNSALTTNASPSDFTISKLERINRLTSFPSTSWFSKLLVLEDWKPTRITSEFTSFEIWPPEIREASPIALPVLFERSKQRVPRQNVSDILPEAEVDLAALANETIPEEAPLPDVPRFRMEDQSRILEYHLRGKSRLAHLNALVISYLRRDTDHTRRARQLFHRIWEEQGPILINELPTRWLISTLQTFLDHGSNEHQRLIGGVGYFYANMMKVYEGERSIEGRDQAAIYEHASPQTPSKFRGLDRFSVGGTDLMLNANALALEIANRNEVAGLVLQEFLLRVKSSSTVFSRLDNTRKEKDISVDGFKDTWAFFEEPQD